MNGSSFGRPGAFEHQIEVIVFLEQPEASPPCYYQGRGEPADESRQKGRLARAEPVDDVRFLLPDEAEKVPRRSSSNHSRH